MTLFATLTLATAVGPIAWLARTRIAGVRQWLGASIVAVAMTGAALMVGPWVLLSVHLRPLVVLALLTALAVAAYRASRMAVDTKAGARLRRLAWQSCIAWVFALVLIDGLAGQFPPSRPPDLHIPLQAGAYAVLQGGNSLVTNPFHHWFPSDGCERGGRGLPRTLAASRGRSIYARRAVSVRERRCPLSCSNCGAESQVSFT